MRRVILLIAFLGLMQACLRQELQTGITEQEAQEMIVLLKKHGLEAEKRLVTTNEGDSWNLLVHGGSQNLFVASRILQENGLPRARVKGLQDVFAESGLIPTASEERAKLLVGLAGELRSTLLSLPGVIDARVHPVLPENSPLATPDQIKPTTASVLIRYQGDNPPLEENQIKALVARGIEGLAPENVVVILKRVQPTRLRREDLRWSLGNQEFTLAALGLMLISTGLALALTVQNRKQRKLTTGLHEQIRRLAQEKAQAVQTHG